MGGEDDAEPVGQRTQTERPEQHEDPSDDQLRDMRARRRGLDERRGRRRGHCHHQR